jgi:hypothetical protein
LTFLRLKYKRIGPEQYDWGSRSSPTYHRKSTAFFKPYLTIEPLNKPETKNITISNLEWPSIERDPEVFKRKVWVLKIRSKEKRLKYSISRTAYNCRIGLGVIRNNRTSFEGLPLKWLGSNKLPSKSNYTGSMRYENRRQQHASALPNSYVARLLAETPDTVKEFLVGTENYALLLFTFEGCEHVYVITHRKDGNIETNITPLDFNREYLFHVRLYSDGFKELHQKRFKFIAHGMILRSKK